MNILSQIAYAMPFIKELGQMRLRKYACACHARAYIALKKSGRMPSTFAIQATIQSFNTLQKICLE